MDMLVGILMDLMGFVEGGASGPSEISLELIAASWGV